MSKEKPRLVRLASIMTQFQSKRLITAEEIASKFDVSKRTVYRDIRTLEASGFPILTEEGKGYSLVEGFKLPPVMFSEGEVNAIMTASKMIESTGDTQLKSEFNKVVTKLKSILKYADKDKSEILEKRIYFRNTTVNRSSNLISIQNAILENQLIKLEYRSRKNEITTREVEPYAVYNTSDNWILVAFCRLRLDYRAFRLDNIKNLDLMIEHYSPRKFTLEDYFEKFRNKKYTLDIPLTPTSHNFELNQDRSYYNQNYKVLKSMKNVKLDAKKFVGITCDIESFGEGFVPTIQKMWDKFSREGVFAKIENKKGSEIYSVYEYRNNNPDNGCRLMIGAEVSDTKNLTNELELVEVPEQEYVVFTSHGNIMQGSVGATWQEIMQSDIPKKFSYDFEVYGEKAKNMEDAEVDIYISVK